jgi:hypothetical protein
MIAPHGGTLITRILEGHEKEERLTRVSSLATIPLTYFALSELDNIACGLYSPLTGYMTSEAYESVIEEMRLPNGTVWPIPIVLPVEASLAKTLPRGRGKHRPSMEQSTKRTLGSPVYTAVRRRWWEARSISSPVPRSPSHPSTTSIP